MVRLGRLLDVLHGSEIQEVRRPVQLVVETLYARKKKNGQAVKRGCIEPLVFGWLSTFTPHDHLQSENFPRRSGLLRLVF